MSESTLNQAIKLADAGFHVIPIIPGDKRPPIVKWQDQATTDHETIKHWWGQQYVGHGIGIAPRNLPDGRWLFVIDVDEKPEENIYGWETYRDLTDAYGPLPDAPTVHSGSGVGKHFYFAAPYEIRNGKTGRLGPGIDIRGNGGQTCAPPTIHKTGNQYTWDLEYNLDTTPIPDAPGWLLQLLKPAEPAQPTRTGKPSIWTELDNSPAGIYNRNKTWEEILYDDGWTFSHNSPDGEQHWTRPGKTAKDGTSATTGYKNLDILKVFTTSLPWLPEGTYSKFKYYAHSKHQGDMSQAAKTILKEQPTTPTMQAAEPTETWPDPIPLTTIHKTPDFPIHTLPAWAVNHIQQTANNIQTPIDLPATLYLGALATIRLGKTHINYPRQNWRQPTNLYCAVAMPPSAGKSPVKQAIFKPIEKLETETITQNRHTRLQAESTKTILEKRMKALQDELANPKTKDPNNLNQTQHNLYETINDLATQTMPPTGQIFVDDTTTEALGEALKDSGGGIAIISAEGGIFDRIAGLYNDGKANMDLYLEGWSGGTYKVNRIRREPIHIPNANITITCTVQPATLDQIGANTEMQGRGLIARFLLCEPDNNVGTRNRTEQQTNNQTIIDLYEKEITRIYNQPQIELHLEGEASDIYAQWDQQLENQLQTGQPLEHLAEWIGKLRASIQRIAALLHHAWQEPGDQISIETISDAIDIGNYYLAHAQKIADRWGSNPTIKDAKTIHEWATRNQIETFSIRELYSANRRRFPSVDLTKEPLILLMERGWIRPLFDGPIQTGKRGQESPRFQTHPLIHSVERKSVDNYAKPVHNSANSVSHARHARHARTPLCVREENSAMRDTPIGDSNTNNNNNSKSLHAHTPPCAHETQLNQSTIDDINLDNLI